ncbi:flagellar biosynthesis repressor FlbT [Lichenicoccus sp.]|uniref:flagellar biosynthesis repressor FlbT n=1 Tax=Lichenicoccus sp. TaxID=2781899 RepID=UPI003D0E10C5
MANLVLDLKPGEMMVINGAAIRFRTRSRLELLTRARFLFGKQIMSSLEAISPLRRIYCALQSAYVGGEADRAPALEQARLLIETRRRVSGCEEDVAILDRIEQHAVADDLYAALRLARGLIDREEAARPPGDAADVAALAGG